MLLQPSDFLKCRNEISEANNLSIVEKLRHKHRVLKIENTLYTFNIQHIMEVVGRDRSLFVLLLTTSIMF